MRRRVLVVLALSCCLGKAQQTTVTIPATSQIYLAGASSGSSEGRDRSPANSPVLVDLQVAGGQALQITATGEVNLDVRQASRLYMAQPNGTEEPWPTPCPGVCTSTICSGANCMGKVWGRRGSLIGVFTGGQNIGANRVANYRSSATSMAVQEPVANLPFVIGNGRTPEGVVRTFIVPRGATRLYLGILDDPVSDNAGSFTANVAVVAPPPDPRTVNPVRLLGHSQIMLAASSAASSLDYGNRLMDLGWLNAPAVIDLTRMGGPGSLRIGAVGAIDLDSSTTGVSPAGRPGTSFTALRQVRQGFSNIASPRGALTGVFTGDEADPTAGNAFTSDFTTPASRNVESVTPLLQQFFYIGTGRTDSGSPKRFIVPAGATRLYLGVNDGPASDNQGSFFVAVSPEGFDVPAFQLSGIVNGGGFTEAPLAAGSIVSIFGSNLSPATEGARSTPLPTTLAQTRVWFNAQEAPLFLVSPNQINAQIPPELSSEAAVQVVVSAGGPPGAPVMLPLAVFRPGIFTYGENAPVIVSFPRGQLVTASEPARVGDTLVIYATGLGAVTPPVQPGRPAPDTPLSRTNTVFNVAIGSLNVQPQFSGLAPGMVGVYQINVEVPPGLPPGPASLSIRGSGAESNKVEIHIRD